MLESNVEAELNGENEDHTVNHMQSFKLMYIWLALSWLIRLLPSSEATLLVLHRAL